MISSGLGRMVVRRGCVKGRSELEARREREACRSREVVAERLAKRGAGSSSSSRCEHAANREYEHYRATAVDRLGRKLSNYNPPIRIARRGAGGKINVTDPDSGDAHAGSAEHSGYNAQAVVTEHQIVIAAEITTQSPDFGHLEPMVSAAVRD